MYYLRWFFISIVIGLVAGAASTVFLYLLTWATTARDHHGYVIWFLPMAGLAIGALYHYLGQDHVRGTDIVLEEVYEPKQLLPWKMAPFILGTTLMTHFFGGSAGREGTAVQMGASLADQLGRFFKFTLADRKMVLIAGMGAGFGSAIGAPLAGMIFGVEVTRDMRSQWRALAPSVVASFTAYGVTRLLMAPHTSFAELLIPPLGFVSVAVVAFLGVVFGSAAYFYLLLARWIKIKMQAIAFAPLRPVLGGVLLIALYSYEGSYQYVGLGLENIQSALITPSSLLEPIYKIFFTALTISSGFKGGEFIPLVFVGSTLGSTIGFIMPQYFSVAAGLGFPAVFAAASKTPLACSIMAVEIFGWALAPYVLPCCFIATYFSGRHSIYESQKR